MALASWFTVVYLDLGLRVRSPVSSETGPLVGSFFLFFNPLTKAGDYKTPVSVSLFTEAGKSNRIHSPQINRDHLLDVVATLTSINPK